MTADLLGDDLSPTVARATGLLMGADTCHALLRLVAATVVHAVQPADGAGVTAPAPDGSPRTREATDPDVLELDALQYSLREGPCLSSWSGRQVLRVIDMRSEDRWPRWARSAADRGYRSSLSAPMVAGDRALGAIKVYARAPDAFTAADESTLSLFAAQAAVLTAAAEGYESAGVLGEHVGTALRRRDLVTRACGVVMGREKVPADAAMAHLMAVAARDSCTVHDAAQRLLQSYEHTQ